MGIDFLKSQWINLNEFDLHSHVLAAISQALMESNNNAKLRSKIAKKKTVTTANELI